MPKTSISTSELWDKRLGCGGGLFPTIKADAHKRRHAALDPMKVIQVLRSHPRIYERLHRELVKAFPDRHVLELGPVERVPYLKAVVMESVRMSYGLSARNPRTHRTSLKYEHWTIPANTSISMTIPDISHDENIFSDSYSFVPERWLNDPKAPDGVPLERYVVSFDRGTRSCLGFNLAHIEMYLTLGMMFRNYKFELHDTDVSDVEMGHDFFIAVTKLSRQGVRAFVVTTDD